MHRSNQDVINSLPEIDCEELSPPPYTSNTRGRKVMLGAKIMEKHMTDEGYQLQQGLAHTDYTLAGAGLTLPHIDVPTILHIANPSTLVIQDKREWDGRTENYGRSRADWMRFQNLSCLRDRTDIFKVTVLKDAQAYPPYFRHFGDEVGIHSWIHYYNRGIVKKLAPYVRAEHCIRTYHSIDADAIPVFDYNRDGALLSGAVSRVYPLRKDLFKRVTELPNVTVKPHPGYKATGCHTPEYLKLLSKFKVVICTCSKFWICPEKAY